VVKNTNSVQIIKEPLKVGSSENWITELNDKILIAMYIETDRIIGHIKGSQPGPTLIFVGGIHGNEPSGVFAIRQVFQELEENKTIINGSIYGLAGNLWALERGERYHKKDLNRLWTSARMKRLNADKMEAENEDEAQQIELFKIIQLIFIHYCAYSALIIEF
jgi:predicted deacylase